MAEGMHLHPALLVQRLSSSSVLFMQHARPFLRFCAALALLYAGYSETIATPLPAPLGPTCMVIVPPAQGKSLSAPRSRKGMMSRHSRFRERLHAWHAMRNLFRKVVDEARTERLAKRSLTYGILAVSALLLAWVPGVGGILLLSILPLGVLAIVNGLKAQHLGSEKTAGLVLGIVSVCLFALVMIFALLFLIGILTLLG